MRPHLRAYAVLAAVFVLLSLGVAVYKQPACDEAWFLNPVVNYFTNGTTGTTILESAGQPWSGVEKYTYWQPPVYFVVLAGWLKIFGVTLSSVRGLSIFCGLIALLAWGRVFRGLGLDPAAALLAFALIACDYSFVTRAADGRMDMMSAAFGVSSLAWYLHWREQRFTMAFAGSQCLLALSGLTHPVGGILNFCGVAALVLLYDRRRISLRHLALGAVPYIAGLALWGVYISRDPVLFRKVFAGNASGRLDGLLNPVRSLQREIMERYLATFGLRPEAGLLTRLKLLIPAAYFFGVFAALFTPALRKDRTLRPLFVLMGLYFFVLAFQDDQKYGVYLVHVLPLFAALLAVWISWVWKARVFPRSLLAVLVAGFLALQAGGALYWVANDTYHADYLSAVSFLRRNVPKGQFIVGPAQLAFGLGFDANLSDDTFLGYYSGKKPDVIVADPRYEENFETYRRRQPAEYRYIQTRLREEYRLVYDYRSFRIYVAV